jgi:hypothetical protein
MSGILSHSNRIRIQQKFVALSCNSFFPHVHYSYAYTLEQFKLHALRKRRCHFDAPFFIQIYFGSKFCPSL